ncbi:hypothetical protein BC828DRAFT_382314 [Blastocladiella britannica]|nr:hypothetical protein BC828DRAFT_382314 [Blastocladiella britannica]
MAAAEYTPVYAWTTTALHLGSWITTLVIATRLVRDCRRPSRKTLSARIETCLWVYLAIVDMGHIAINLIHATSISCAGQPTTYGIEMLDPQLPCVNVWLDVICDGLESTVGGVYPLLLLNLTVSVFPEHSIHASRGRLLWRIQAASLVAATLAVIFTHTCGSLPAVGIEGVSAFARACSDNYNNWIQMVYCGTIVLAIFVSVGIVTMFIHRMKLRHEESAAASPSVRHDPHHFNVKLLASRTVSKLALHSNSNSRPSSHSGLEHPSDPDAHTPAHRFAVILRSMYMSIGFIIGILTFFVALFFFWTAVPNVVFTALIWLGTRFVMLMYYLAMRSVAVLLRLRRQIPNPDAGTLAASHWVQDAGAPIQTGMVKQDVRVAESLTIDRTYACD